MSKLTICFFIYINFSIILLSFWLYFKSLAKSYDYYLKSSSLNNKPNIDFKSYRKLRKLLFKIDFPLDFDIVKVYSTNTAIIKIGKHYFLYENSALYFWGDKNNAKRKEKERAKIIKKEEETKCI